MVLGASNLWFGVTLSALHLPVDDPASTAISQHWSILGAQSSPDVLAAIVAGMPALHALRALSPAELAAAVEEERQRGAGQEGGQQEVGNLLDAEWELFAHPTTKKQDDDFRAMPTPNPDRLDGLLRQVVQVERLREVQAMLGFTRIEAPARGDASPALRVGLSSGRVPWVPAVERRGEGIFLELREEPVAAWSGAVAQHPHVQALTASYGRWRGNRDLPPDLNFPVARYLLIHTLSHLLLRQVALKCGLTETSTVQGEAHTRSRREC